MKNINNKVGFFVSLFILVLCSAVTLSILSRLTNIFFIPSLDRYIVLICSLLLSLLFVIIFRKTISFWINQLKTTRSRHIIIRILVILNLIFSTVLTFYIPKPKFPLNHSLTIEVISTEENVENIIQISRLRKQIDEPEPGSDYIDLRDLEIEGKNYEFLENELLLREGCTVYYESFFSGCMSIFLKTSPESHLIRVQFDHIEERYSLYSLDENETEVQICAPLSLQRLSLKWKIVVIGLYIVDILTLFVILCLIEIIIFLFLKLNEDPGKYRKFLISCFFVISIFASIDQVVQIWKYPSSRNTGNLPPLRPSLITDVFNFGSIYAESLHTKKFAHAFIFNFLDLCPGVENVYIDQKTIDEYGFGSFEFRRWFSAYNPKSIEYIPDQLSKDDIQRLIDTENWSKKEFNLVERNRTFCINHLNQIGDEYVFITNQEDQFYIFTDVMIQKLGEEE